MFSSTAHGRRSHSPPLLPAGRHVRIKLQSGGLEAKPMEEQFYEGRGLERTQSYHWVTTSRGAGEGPPLRVQSREGPAGGTEADPLNTFQRPR